MLEKFEFTLQLYSISQVHEWIHQTLRTITSPLFNEFVIWILHMTYRWDLLSAMNADGWNVLDASLGALAERNPDFRVVFRGDCTLFRCGLSPVHDRTHSFFEKFLPVVASKDFAKFECVPHHVSNPCWELRSV